jgi:hypothetical protein
MNIYDCVRNILRAHGSTTQFTTFAVLEAAELRQDTSRATETLRDAGRLIDLKLELEFVEPCYHESQYRHAQSLEQSTVDWWIYPVIHHCIYH